MARNDTPFCRGGLERAATGTRSPKASLTFFFYSSADHRILHSFPTRRSSDLITLFANSSTTFLPQARFNIDGTAEGTRSEEHTSELQSRLHLVCRLLLEKKKTAELPAAISHERLLPTATGAWS